MNFNMMTAMNGAVALAALGIAIPAQAATSIDFETDANGNQAVIGDAVVNAYSPLGVTFSGALFRRCGGGCPQPVFGTFISSINFVDPFSVIFSTSVSNFSFANVSNSGSFASAFDANGNLLQTINFSGFPSTFSFSSNNIKSVQFGGGGGGFGVDNFAFTASSAVPEPTTWAMLMLGLFGIGTAMRRSRQKQSATLSYT